MNYKDYVKIAIAKKQISKEDVRTNDFFCYTEEQRERRKQRYKALKHESNLMHQ